MKYVFFKNTAEIYLALTKSKVNWNIIVSEIDDENDVA